VKSLREEYQRDIDIHRLASELVIDAIVPGKSLRQELARRFAIYAQGYLPTPARKRGVLPV
jgi:acetyl-CoA carboxylase carboxyltransferase component